VNLPPEALEVRVVTSLRSLEAPTRSLMVMGVVLSVVVHSMVYEFPATTVVGTLVNWITLDWAATRDARAEAATRRVLKKRILTGAGYYKGVWGGKRWKLEGGRVCKERVGVNRRRRVERA